MKRLGATLVLAFSLAGCETVEERRVVRGYGMRRTAERRIEIPPSERPSASKNLPIRETGAGPRGIRRPERPVASNTRPPHIPRDEPWPPRKSSRQRKLKITDINIPWWLFF
jgi:hypothetical protein